MIFEQKLVPESDNQNRGTDSSYRAYDCFLSCVHSDILSMVYLIEAKYKYHDFNYYTPDYMHLKPFYL